MSAGLRSLRLAAALEQARSDLYRAEQLAASMRAQLSKVGQQLVEIRRALDELEQQHEPHASAEPDACRYCEGPLNRDGSCARSCVGVGDG